MNPIHFEVGETAVTILSDEKFHGIAKEAIFEAREIVKAKLDSDPFFGVTYDPYPVDQNDDYLIKRMCQASVLAGVGPMASVAGAVACFAVERMVEHGADFAIVENGGDIAIRADRDVKVALFSDNTKFGNLALDIKRREGIFGVCSSSATVGPSVSLGSSSISTVISKDVVLADACATALGNLSRDATRDTLSDAVETIQSIDGVDCCIVISGDLMASCGDVPDIVECEPGTKAAGLLYNR